MKFFKRLIDSVEQSDISWGYFALSFFFVMSLRNFLEIFSDQSRISFSFYLHFYSSYIALALAIILLMHFLTRQPIMPLIKLVMAGFVIILFAPLFDLVATGGQGFNIAYLLPGQHDDLFRRYLTFFGAVDVEGITPGMRVEIALVLLAAFFYLRLKTSNLVKSLLGTWALYTLIFVYTAVPFWIKGFLGWFGLSDQTADLAITRRNFYFLIGVPLLMIVFYRLKSSYFLAVIKDFRFLRLIHFILLFLLGFHLSQRGFSVLRLDDALFYFIFVMVAISLAWLFSVMTNNIADQDIDRVSNVSRPLVTGVVPLPDYKKIIWLVAVLMILYAALPGFTFLFLLLLFVGGYWLYSMPPFRCKRLPLFSKVFIGFNSLVMLMLGYSFTAEQLATFPRWLIFVMLVLFSLGANFIDIKDYAGDRAAGVKTLPTLLGLRRSQRLIGFFWLIGFLGMPFFLDRPFIWPVAVIGGLWSFWALTRKDYNERLVFYPYLLTLLFLFLTGFK